MAKRKKVDDKQQLIDEDFTLEALDAALSDVGKKAKKKTAKKTSKKRGDSDIVSYRHQDKRVNNPEVGMVTPVTDPGDSKTRWAYDPHLDPELQFDSSRAQVEKIIDDALDSGDEETMRESLKELKRLQSPYLNWTGKAERTSFEIDTVSLHVHERIDPASILSAVRKSLKKGKGEYSGQSDMFQAPFENMPLRDAIDFYKHEKGWSNRLIAGDSLLVMNSLLQKESMAGQVQMIYIDPPYGIKYGSNFQPFVDKRDVKDRKDEDLTQEPEMIKAFRDTWEIGIHSYLTYLRDRLLLAIELLSESGSIFIQISEENLHHVRELMDEILRPENYITTIAYATTSGFKTNTLSRAGDYILWYAKEKSKIKYNKLLIKKEGNLSSDKDYRYLELEDGKRISINQFESDYPNYDKTLKIFRYGDTTSQDPANDPQPYSYRNNEYLPSTTRHWTANYPFGMDRLNYANRLVARENSLAFIRYWDDAPYFEYNNLWDDTSVAGKIGGKIYVVQTNEKVIERCLLMCTDPGDLVIDPTCGSGTTAFVAEKQGRRWITCDTSRVAVTLAKQRLTTTSYDYYDLKYPHEGLKAGFIYNTFSQITLKSIANNVEIDSIYKQFHPAIKTSLISLNKETKQKLKEWEVPYEFPKDWKESAKKIFDAFHEARNVMRKRIDESIAANAGQEILYDQPQIAKDKLRITGPFSVEAVPFPTVLALNEAERPVEADITIARSGESARQHLWRDELLKTGIRGKVGDIMKFAELETLPDTRYLHCSGTLSDSGDRVVVSFGPEHAALEQRQVANALTEAGELFPLPKMIVFCAFTFDPEAAKDIDHMKGITALKAQMNTDLLTEDLKKNRSSNQSFWLMGQPDAVAIPVETPKGEEGEWFKVEVYGYDYFNTKTGELESGGTKKIAMWSLDTDYDERSLYPQQVFFPMAGAKDGWNKLKKTIRAELDESRLAEYHGTVSLPFKAGENCKSAIKIVDDRGIESLKIIPLDQD
jgi:adenine-specific DNA-methyltransferase